MASEWINVESLDGALATLATDLKAAVAGVKIQRFVVVNSELSSADAVGGGLHWFPLEYSIEVRGPTRTTAAALQPRPSYPPPHFPGHSDSCAREACSRSAHATTPRSQLDVAELGEFEGFRLV
eukprot:3224990-Prymnesium_polylepis.1